MRLLIIATFLLSTLSTAGSAGDMCPCESDAYTSCSLRVSVCPCGNFEFIRNGCGGDSDYIEGIFRDCDGGMPGVPVTDFWMNACDEEQGLHFCPGAFVADAPTDSLGRTTFSGQIAAGGFVNLSDLSFFGQSYNHQLEDPEYDPCTDYNDDDWCNLSDFSFMGEHYQHECL